MRFEVSNHVDVTNPTQDFKEWCQDNLILSNPEYAKKLSMGLKIWNTPREIYLFEKMGNGYRLPFGCVADLMRRYPDVACVSRIKGADTFSYHSAISLYGYQERAVNEALKAKNGVLVMPCGSGKTQCALEIISRLGLKALWLTHTQDLLRQSMDRAKSVLNCDAKSYGTITGGKVNIGTGITFATVQTMSKLDLAQYRDEWGVVVVDECLPAHTKISTPNGDKELKNLCIGDIVTSYNRDTGKIEDKPILNVFKLKAHDIVKVNLQNRNSVIATGNHPFFVKDKGWIEACDIGGGDYVMQLVRDRVRRNKEAANNKKQNKKEGLRLLLSRVCVQSRAGKTSLDGRTKTKIGRAHEEGQRRISRSNNRPHEEQQSYERPRDEAKSIKAFKRDRASSQNTMREWVRANCSSTDTDACISRVRRRICGVSHSDKTNKRQWLSNLLQGGHSDTGTYDCSRGGRKFSLCRRASKAGCKERYALKWVRVDSIEVPKQTSDGTFGRLCPDGYVYNIEVADNNNYFADDILVHNCHKAIGSPTKVMQFYKVLSNLSCRYKFGLTATPRRADGLECAMYALIGNKVTEVSRYSVASTTCPVLIKRVNTGYFPNIDAVLAGDGTINYAALINDLVSDNQRFKLVLDVIAKAESGGPMLVLASRVEYLQRLNDKYAGKSICLSGLSNTKAGKAKRKDALQKLNSGELNCVFATYQLAKEGLDVPNLRTLIMATPEKDPTTIEQSVGRVARKADGKLGGTVIDFVDSFGMFKGWAKKRTGIYKKLGMQCELADT